MTEPLRDNIETIESGYEYLLAYAAQGRESDQGMDVRTTLQNMCGAARAIVAGLDGGDFAGIVADDARKTLAAIDLVLKQERISSELVDNLNISIHLRALLTDLFLLSETVT